MTRQQWPLEMMRRPWQPEDGDTKCQECFCLNPVWWVQHEVWNSVVGSNDGGVLCPNCFIALADTKGYGRSGAWQLYPPSSLR
jgi:hypothetical protein